MKRETVFGILGVLLYTQPSVAQKSVTDTVRLNFNIDSVALEEVVVKGARTPAANSRWSDMHPVELVTVGGANGDLYKALQTLPVRKCRVKPVNCWYVVEAVTRRRLLLMECMY